MRHEIAFRAPHLVHARGLVAEQLDSLGFGDTNIHLSVVHGDDMVIRNAQPGTVGQRSANHRWLVPDVV